MPLAQLISAATETLANGVVDLSPHKQGLLTPLHGKRLKLALAEIPWAITIAVSDQLHILMDDTAEADCTISTRLEVLPKLQDTSQLTRLIKADDLTLEGDIHLAQRFAELFRNLAIDWEGVLAGYVGDVMAHKAFALAKGQVNAHQQRAENLRQLFKDALLEETPIAAHPLAVEEFNLAVSTLRTDTDRLDANLRALQQRVSTQS